MAGGSARPGPQSGQSHVVTGSCRSFGSVAQGHDVADIVGLGFEDLEVEASGIAGEQPQTLAQTKIVWTA